MSLASRPSENSALRGAILGFGNVAIHAHLPLWRANCHVRIEAVLEPNPQQAELARKLLPDTRIYSEIALLLRNHDLHFVDICTPPCFHGNLLLQACQSGLDVLCEKPLVTSWKSLHEVEEIAEKSERVIFTVNNWKFAPLWVKAVQLINEGEIGAVQSVSLTVLRSSGSGGGVSDWRRCPEVAGGGILFDHGWHHMYLILSMIRDVPLSVSAKMEYSKAFQLEEIADVVIRFRNAEARLHLTWRAPYRRNFGTITGDRGTILLNDDHFILKPDGVLARRYDFPEALSKGSHHPEWMEPVIEDFLQEVNGQKGRGANLREGKWCAQLIFSAYQSHREGSRFIPVGDQTV